MRSRSTGEAAALMTEEFALDQRFRQRATVHGDEWSLPALGQLMNRVRDELLTRSALAQDDYRGAGIGYFVKHVE